MFPHIRIFFFFLREGGPCHLHSSELREGGGTRLVMVHKPYLRVLSNVRLGIQLYCHKIVVAGRLSFIIKVERELNAFSSS